MDFTTAGNILWLMTMLTNARHEVFAQELARGLTQTQSAKNAGYSEKTADVTGSKLAKRPEVRARVKELSERGSNLAIAATGISKQWVLGELSFVVECNRGKTAAVKPLELIGREIGMFQDMIPRQVFDIIMFRMGEAVLRFIDDPVTLDKIVTAWSMIKEQHPLTRGNFQSPAADTPSSEVETAVDPPVSDS